MYPFKNIALNRNRKIIAVANPSADITQMVAKAVPGVANNYRGVWDPSGTYTNGEMVLYSNVVWLCLASTTTATPATGSTVWQAIGSYSAFLGAWSSSTAYVVGDEVTYGGNFYFCTTANTNQTPSTSSSYWQIAGPASLANVADDPGGTWRKVGGVNTGNLIGFKSLVGDTSGDNNTPLVDAANKRFLHGAMSTGVQGVISSGSQVNVNPSGGVTGNLPQANHDPTVLLSSVTGNQRNLIPDSGLKNVKAYWTDYSGGLISVTQSFDGHTNIFTYIGTGSASGFLYQASKPITVNPGTYTLSAIGWVNNVTSGTMFIGVYNTALTTQYGSLNLTPNSRASSQVTIPSGVSQVVVIFDTSNATVANGQGSGVQDMQFEPGAVMTAYRENTGDNLSGTLLIDTGNSNHVGNWQHSYMSTPTKNTIATTVGGDGSYLNPGQVFNRHLNNATQSGLADDATYLRWKASQQTALVTNPGANHIVDPNFTSIADFWGGTNSASAGVLNQGTVAASAYSQNFNYDGRGNQVKVKLDPGDTLVLQLTFTQAPTGTAVTYITAEFQQSNGTHISYANTAYVPGSGTGTGTSVTTAPANTAYAYIFIQTFGGASGGNAALVTSPQARINHETVTDPNALKAYVDFSDTTSGGHVAKSNWADATQMGTNIQGGTGLTDGETITFASAYSGDPEIVFGDGGLTYDSTLGAVSQFQDFSASFTHSGGQTTGFTAALKISTVGGALTSYSQNFSSDSVTLSIASGVIANGALTVSGSVYNSQSEINIITITLTDTTHSISWHKNVSVPAGGNKPFSFAITDTSAANGTVFTLGYSSGGSDSGTPTISYQTQTAATVHSATPAGVPGVSWVAFSAV